MIKNIFFYGLLAIATLFLACQDKKEESTVKKENEIEVELKEKHIKSAIRKYDLDNYHILGYFTFDKDSLVTIIDSIKPSVQKLIENTSITQVVLDQEYLTLQSAESKRTWKTHKVGDDLFIINDGQNILVCKFTNKGKSILVYQSFFQISATHNVSDTKALYNNVSYGVLEKEQLLQEFDFLTGKSGYLLQVCYELDIL